MKNYCYFDGKIVDIRKPHLPLDDIGVLRGFGVFDFFRIYNSKPFLLDEHYKRFVNSAKLIGFKLPISKDKLEVVLQSLLKKNKMKDAHVRMVLTGGRVKDGILPSKPTFYILFEERKDLPHNLYTKGASLMVYEHQRLLPQAKTTNYFQAVQLQAERQRLGAIEILYVDKGKVLEAATSNIFIVKKGVVITPKDNVLYGITRNLVIRLAKKEKLKVVERDIKVDELYKADEVFLSATNKKVLPIVKINGKKIGNGRPGDITLRLLERYEEFVDIYSK